MDIFDYIRGNNVRKSLGLQIKDAEQFWNTLERRSCEVHILTLIPGTELSKPNFPPPTYIPEFLTKTFSQNWIGFIYQNRYFINGPYFTIYSEINKRMTKNTKFLTKMKKAELHGAVLSGHVCERQVFYTLRWAKNSAKLTELGQTKQNRAEVVTIPVSHPLDGSLTEGSVPLDIP